MDTNEVVLLPTLIKRSTRLIHRHIEQSLKAHHIARSQYTVLYYVAKFGQPTQKELADALEIQGPTLTSMLDSLVQKGWLVREQDARDKRSKQLRLTAAGKQLFAQIPNPAEALDHMIRESLSAEETAALRQALEKIITKLS